MPSTFTWLDHSERDRERMLDVIDLFAEPDTRDELGLGGIRDSFAEQLFPGVSVVQTRARYLLFVPWMYLDLEHRGVPAGHVETRARRDEIALINQLSVAPDHDGTIGIQARDKLKRLPSNVYWQALGRYGIRLFPGRLDLYHRSFDAFQQRTSRHHALARERDDETGEPTPLNWHAGLPSPPDDFPTRADFLLRREEAEYLQERILTTAPGTLLAFLADRGRPHDRTTFPWVHPQAGNYPDRIRELLHHARCFSEAIHGAPLLYNLMLAEQTDNSGRDNYRDFLAGWAGELAGRSVELADWDRQRFWELVRNGPSQVTFQAQTFVNGWLELALSSDQAEGVADNDAARELVRERERQLKGPLARLDNRRSLELWNGSSGMGRMAFRWHTAQTLVGDILAGLNGDQEDA